MLGKKISNGVHRIVEQIHEIKTGILCVHLVLRCKLLTWCLERHQLSYDHSALPFESLPPKSLKYRWLFLAPKFVPHLRNRSRGILSVDINSHDSNWTILFKPFPWIILLNHPRKPFSWTIFSWTISLNSHLAILGVQVCLHGDCLCMNAANWISLIGLTGMAWEQIPVSCIARLDDLPQNDKPVCHPNILRERFFTNDSLNWWPHWIYSAFSSMHIR